jgi:hypothetical protein
MIKALLQAIIDNCPDSSAASLRNLSPLGHLRLRRAARVGSGLSGAEWRKHGDDVIAEVNDQRQAATDADLQALIDEAKAA